MRLLPLLLLILILVLVLTACSATQGQQIAPIEVRTVEVQRPAPIVPAVDQLRLRQVSWTIITPENIEEKFAELQNSDQVFFALTATGYENISLNMSDIRAIIEQQQRVIAVYQNQY